MAIQQNFPSSRPSLNLNFARSKKLDPRITFTRTSSATYVGEDGLIKIAPANAARFDHDPIAGESLGLLVEEQRTNLMLRSEDFTTTWTTQEASITANAIAAPSGALTAAKVVENTNTTPHDVRQVRTFVSGTSYSYSVYLKAAERTRVFLIGANITTFPPRAVFDLSNGTIVSNAAGIATIESVKDGWYRCSVTGAAGASASTNLRIVIINTGTNQTYTGDGTSGIYIWGAQLEQGSFPTSYIPTAASTVTRTPDFARIIGTNFSSWYNFNEGTFISNSSILKSGIQTQFVWSLADGTNQISLRSPQVTGDRFRGNIGNVFTPTPGTGNTLVTTSKAAIAYNSALGRLQVGNSSDEVVPSQLPTLTSLNVFAIGNFAIGNSGAGGNSLNGTIRQITYYPSRLTNAQLQTLTK